MVELIVGSGGKVGEMVERNNNRNAERETRK